MTKKSEKETPAYQNNGYRHSHGNGLGWKVHLILERPDGSVETGIFLSGIDTKSDGERELSEMFRRWNSQPLLLAQLKAWNNWAETLPGGIEQFEKFARKQANWADAPIPEHTRSAIAKAGGK